jgi:hypothetical protein
MKNWECSTRFNKIIYVAMHYQSLLFDIQLSGSVYIDAGQKHAYNYNFTQTDIAFFVLGSDQFE